METIKSILIIQTAFIGDVVLTLPLAQKIKRYLKQSSIDILVTPKAAGLLVNHPSISKVIPYDKHGKDKGLIKFFQLGKRIKEKQYDLILVPHRSLRSALLTWLLKPNLSIGFDTSAGKKFFKYTVTYSRTSHEIERNLYLLKPLNLPESDFELPILYPTKSDVSAIDSVMWSNDVDSSKMVAVAPGTIWNTKRWPKEKYAEVCKQLSTESYVVWLIGSKEDKDLCDDIVKGAQSDKVINVAGKLTLLQSAELIRRCKLLISNDSAPMHLAVAVRTPVVAIFGATVPEFGFAPRGEKDTVVEIMGLKCRPCSIHGGKKCPIKTFECMNSITSEMVMEKVKRII